MTILDITLELKYKSAIIIINYNNINGEQFFGGTELTKKPPLCRQGVRFLSRTPVEVFL